MAKSSSFLLAAITSACLLYKITLFPLAISPFLHSVQKASAIVTVRSTCHAFHITGTIVYLDVNYNVEPVSPVVQDIIVIVESSICVVGNGKRFIS